MAATTASNDGVYITGIYSPSTAAARTAYVLTLVPDQGGSVPLFNLSLFGIVGALIVLVLFLFTAAWVIARRRRYAIREFNESMALAAQAEDVGTMRRLQMMAAARGLTSSGLVLLQQPQGASEEEIRGAARVQVAEERAPARTTTTPRAARSAWTTTWRMRAC